MLVVLGRLFTSVAENSYELLAFEDGIEILAIEH